MKFPKDFKKKKHPIVPNATQWLLHDSKGNVIISIVGGGTGLYGNGTSTFEMYDFSEDGPKGWLSKIDINEHLKNRAF